uniref:Peptidase metallopeptidase domain-containing protein n=1 Tax=Timema cristinae TaxID=61476 RepID=A0A7R9CWF9_TIMCR|nr:unnamed protein product [Timema cristinae]
MGVNLSGADGQPASVHSVVTEPKASPAEVRATTLTLSLSGEIDHETAHTMSLPRCGVKDKVGYGTDSRSKRYALQGNCTDTAVGSICPSLRRQIPVGPFILRNLFCSIHLSPHQASLVEVTSGQRPEVNTEPSTSAASDHTSRPIRRQLYTYCFIPDITTNQNRAQRLHFPRNKGGVKEVIPLRAANKSRSEENSRRRVSVVIHNGAGRVQKELYPHLCGGRVETTKVKKILHRLNRTLNPDPNRQTSPGEIDALSNVPTGTGSRWRVKALTYRISKYPSTSRLNKEDVDKELNNAFNVWAGVTDLSFTQKDSGQVHIEIRFEKGEHGDGDPFDGPGGTLAHAYFPVYGGDAHFDDAETWTIQSYRGTNLFQVAAHEFGHSLGLSHSDVKSALMAPFYRGYEPIFKLDQDDVQGIQERSGRPSKARVLLACSGLRGVSNRFIAASLTSRPTSHLTPLSRELEETRLDPHVLREQRAEYSGGSQQYMLTHDALQHKLETPDYQYIIARHVITSLFWRILRLLFLAVGLTTRSRPDDLEAVPLFQALYGKKSKGGSDDHTTSSTTEQSGRDGEGVNSEEDPILCKDGSVDTMFNSAEGVTYVFKGDNYWKLTADGVAANYPRLITRSWKGLPGNMDAAFTYRNGKTYFFKGDQYWRYIGKKMDGEYPKPISSPRGSPGSPTTWTRRWCGVGTARSTSTRVSRGLSESSPCPVRSKFWRFDPSQRPPVKSTYPKPISNWEGIPDNVDAALQYTNGYTYFFKGNAYYRFNDRTFAVDTADPAFPRSAGHWWFGCTTQTSGTYKPGNRPGFSWYTHSGEDEGAAAVDNNEQRDRADSHDSDVDDLILDAGTRCGDNIPPIVAGGITSHYLGTRCGDNIPPIVTEGITSSLYLGTRCGDNIPPIVTGGITSHYLGTRCGDNIPPIVAGGITSSFYLGTRCGDNIPPIVTGGITSPHLWFPDERIMPPLVVHVNSLWVSGNARSQDPDHPGTVGGEPNFYQHLNRNISEFGKVIESSELKTEGFEGSNKWDHGAL